MRAKLCMAVVSLCALLGAGGAFGATPTATATVPPTRTFTPTPTPTSNRTTDLSVTKVASPSPVLLGQELTYTLTIHNGGPSNALNVSLQDNLPADVTLVSANLPGGTCSFSSLQVQCSLNNPNNLPAGGNLQAVLRRLEPAVTDRGAGLRRPAGRLGKSGQAILGSRRS